MRPTRIISVMPDKAEKRGGADPKKEARKGKGDRDSKKRRRNTERMR